jgi:predicted porin
MNGHLQVGGSPSGADASKAFFVGSTNNDDRYNTAWEGALRYEGKWQEVGVTLGGGYTHVGLQTDNAALDNISSFHQWNLGAAFTWQQLGLGVAYTDDNGGIDSNGKNRTWDVGVDWTTGPFKLGASYLNNHEGLGQEVVAGVLRDDGHLNTTRWAGGVVYTYGPGMTFRGSVGWVRSTFPQEQLGATDPTHAHATDVLLGTQINF